MGLAAVIGRTGVVALGAAAVGGHLGYPLVLLALTARRPPRPVPAPPTEWPAITVLVPAFREAGVISRKIADVRANGYEGALQVLVVAEDPETAASAREAGATVVAPEARLGKAQALNTGVARADHDILVFSDANNRLAAGAIAAAVAHLGDPAVGAVAGEKVEQDGGGEELYWRFESWLKRREWHLGTTIGIVGELVAVRRAAWRDIPPDISSDDLWLALDLAERSWTVAYEPAARSIDPPVGGGDRQWERRTRISAGALFVFTRKAHLLHPRHGLVALEIWGHKLWRSTLGPLAHLVLVALSVWRWRSSRLAALVVVGHAVGAGALVRRERGGSLPRLVAAGVQVLYLQLVALGGVVRFLRRDRVLQWAKPAR